MNKMLALLFSIAIAFPVTAAEKVAVAYDYKITRVIDGDTVAFEATFLPDPLKKELSIRVFGVDTPEKGHRASAGRASREAAERGARGRAGSI